MPKPTICLAMIVRDEAEVIERCIESASPLVDEFVIVDTGSTDGTEELICEMFEDDSAVIRRPWVNFGHNRTELLNLAKGKADYLLLLDADMTVEQTGDWPEELPDACMLRIPSDDMEYRLPLLVRSDLDWRYEGVTHEYLTTDDEHTTGNVDHLVVHHHLDGGTRAEKFERDRTLLEGSWESDPPRTTFYLAQTLRDLGRWEDAVYWYEHRAELGGFEEEVYYSLLQIGIGRDSVGALLEAWAFRPQRLEALYEAVSRLRLRGLHRAAYELVKGHTAEAPPDDVLFVSPWVYRYGLLFEFSIAAYWVGDHQASLDACDRLLEMDDLPEAYREQTITNQAYAIGAVGVAA